VILGMLGGGTSFLVHYQTLKGSPSAWWRSTEARVWLLLVGGFLALLVTEQAIAGAGMFAADNPGIEHGIRTNLFQVLAILTTTGYATQDIASPYYGAAAHLLFLTMMLVGGCVGSTSGGFKVLRILILAKVFGRVVAGIVAPRGAIGEVVLDGRIVPAPEVRRVAGLFFVWIALLGFGGLVTAFTTHHDAMASVSGMFSALNNIGPCYIPTPEMAELPAVVKVVYMLGMLAGRLEILPIALLFSPRAWKE
jgi:trk system potassium uptake protein TrkH